MRRKLLLLGTFVLAVVVLYLAVREYGQLEIVANYELKLRGLVERFPLISFAIGLLLYTLLSLIPGTTGKSFVFGWVFGFWPALVQANVGLTIAAVVTFLLSRYVFRDVIQSKFGYYVTRFNKALEREGAYVVISLRMLHAPYSFVNYTMGTTSITTKTFWWSTQIGLLPGNVVFVLAGAQLPTLRALLTKGAPAVFTSQFIAAFVLMAVFPWVIRYIIDRVRRRIRIKAVKESGLLAPQAGTPTRGASRPRLHVRSNVQTAAGCVSWLDEANARQLRSLAEQP